MPDALSPKPPGMPVVIHHDGVTWTVPRRPLVAIVTGCLVVSAGPLGIYGATIGAPWVAVFPVLLAAWTWFSAARAPTLVLDARALVATSGVTRVRIPLDEVASFGLTDEDDGRSEAALMIRTGQETHRLAVGAPREHLTWFAHGLGVAIDAFRAREAAEGREWKFQRAAPEALQRMREPGEGGGA